MERYVAKKRRHLAAQSDFVCLSGQRLIHLPEVSPHRVPRPFSFGMASFSDGIHSHGFAPSPTLAAPRGRQTVTSESGGGERGGEDRAPLSSVANA